LICICFFFSSRALSDGNHIPGSVFTVIVRDYESLGGEGKIIVFFSTTSSSEKGRQDVFKLETLLTAKKIHQRPDFEPWTPVDLMDRDDREAVFRRAGTRNLPIIFIDDQYVGDFDTLERANEAGRLDELLKTIQHSSLYDRDNALLGNKPTVGSTVTSKFTSAPSVAQATAAVSNLNIAANNANTATSCPRCKAVNNGKKFCGECGTKLT
jgi:glutaredoxin